MNRGFRYQTGEIDMVAKELEQNGFSQVDVDKESEIEEVLTDLAEYGIEHNNDYTFEYKVADMNDEHEFYSRVNFPDGKYIDFFLVDQPEESYDEIFWG